MKRKPDHRVEVRHFSCGASAKAILIFEVHPAADKWDLDAVSKDGSIAQVVNVMADTPRAWAGLVNEIEREIKRRGIRFVICEVPVSSDPGDVERQGHLLGDLGYYSRLNPRARIHDRSQLRLAGTATRPAQPSELNHMLALSAALEGRYARHPVRDPESGVYSFLAIFDYLPRAA
jgi:hypothetical protein